MGSNVNYIRQVPKFLQGHMHFMSARTDEDVQEQLTAKRELPQWDSDEDEAAEKEVSIYSMLVIMAMMAGAFAQFRPKLERSMQSTFLKGLH